MTEDAKPVHSRYCNEAGCSRSTTPHLWDPETCPGGVVEDADDLGRRLAEMTPDDALCEFEGGHLPERHPQFEDGHEPDAEPCDCAALLALVAHRLAGDLARLATPFEPPGLRDLINSMSYKPGWLFQMALFREDGEARGWAFYVISETPDSYDHEKTIRVRHEFLIPPASYNRDTWVAWLFDRIRQVEDHEAGEFFKVDGYREFAPHHGNGEDPYRVWHVGDHEAARKKAGQD